MRKQVVLNCSSNPRPRGISTSSTPLFRRRLLSGRDQSSLDLGIGIFRTVCRTFSIYGIISRAHFLTLKEVGPDAVTWYEAHRQARRIRHRHENTGSSRNASHGAFTHECMRVTDLRWTVRLVATVGRSLRFTGSAARMFLASLPCVDT
jgi:hypothetical protein